MGQMDDYVSVTLEHKFVAYNGVFLCVCVSNRCGNEMFYDNTLN